MFRGDCFSKTRNDIVFDYFTILLKLKEPGAPSPALSVSKGGEENPTVSSACQPCLSFPLRQANV